MSDTNQPEAPLAAEVQKGSQRERVVRVRIWPAILIVLVQFAATFGFWFFGSTNIQSAVQIGVIPLFAALLLIIWWLAASRTPWLARLAGFGLFLAAIAWVVLTQSTRGKGGMLLAYAMPTMTTGIVALLVMTYRLRWPVRRAVVVLFMIGCAGVFSALRVDTVGGNLAPHVSWRWTPTDEERSKTLPLAEAHGTAILPAQVDSSDWPAFRGVARDGRLNGTKFSTDWSTPPREVWRRQVGPAWSSFTVVGDYVFTQEQSGSQELVTCYHAATGEPVWVNRVDGLFEDGMGLGPRATPTYDQGRLYTQGCAGTLQCLDAATGNTIWKRNLTADAERGVPGYGFTGSPLIVKDLVIVFASGSEGKSAIAYKAVSGDVAWRAGHGTTAYPSPHLALLGGVAQVVMASDSGLQSFTPDTGALLWEWKGKAPYPRCVQPLVVDSDLVMLGTTGTVGARLFRVQKKDDSWNIQEEWMSKSFRPYFNDGVLHKGYCYGFDGDRLGCIDVKTGARRWEGKRYGGQVLLVADMDTLLVLSEKGDVALVQATAERFNEIARFNAITGKTWNHPVIAHGKLFVRNAEEAACFELAP